MNTLLPVIRTGFGVQRACAATGVNTLAPAAAALKCSVLLRFVQSSERWAGPWAAHARLNREALICVSLSDYPLGPTVGTLLRCRHNPNTISAAKVNR